MKYRDLINLLEPVGLPVVEPGELGAVMPCIAVEPVGMATSDGYSWLYDECNIKVIFPLAQNNPDQFFALRDATVAVWRQLWGTKVEVDADGPLFGETESDPPSLFFELAARFPSDDLCAQIPDTPARLTDIDDNWLTDAVGNYLTT